jgi:hypothetical protein
MNKHLLKVFFDSEQKETDCPRPIPYIIYTSVGVSES